MATFNEQCRRRGTHPAHSWKRTRFTFLHGRITDTYKCRGVKAFGR